MRFIHITRLNISEKKYELYINFRMQGKISSLDPIKKY